MAIAELKDKGEGIPDRWAVFVHGKYVGCFETRTRAQAYVKHLNKVTAYKG